MKIFNIQFYVSWVIHVLPKYFANGLFFNSMPKIGINSLNVKQQHLQSLCFQNYTVLQTKIIGNLSLLSILINQISCIATKLETACVLPKIYELCSVAIWWLIDNIEKIHFLRLEFNKTVKCWQRWKKLTKLHSQNFEPEKLAHKICAKNAQNRAQMTKIAQKMLKPF